MAIYHCNIKNVCRSKGQCSLATLSYQLRTDLTCDYLKKSFSFRHYDQKFIKSDFMQPEPQPFKTVGEAFNKMEDFEKNTDARLAKNIEVSLPREFSYVQAENVIRAYCQKNFVDNGYCCNWSIHNDKKNHNPHCHILVFARPLDKEGNFGAKYKKQYVRDENGNKVPIIDPKTGEQKIGARGRKMWKRENVIFNKIDDRDFFIQLRKSWADECNKILPNDKQISHLSLKEQGIDREPINYCHKFSNDKEAKAEQQELKAKKEELKFTDKQIAELEKEIEQAIKEREQIAREQQQFRATISRRITNATNEFNREAERHHQAKEQGNRNPNEIIRRIRETIQRIISKIRSLNIETKAPAPLKPKIDIEALKEKAKQKDLQQERKKENEKEPDLKTRGEEARLVAKDLEQEQSAHRQHITPTQDRD